MRYKKVTDFAPTPIGVVIADRGGALWALWFLRTTAKDERRLRAIAFLSPDGRIVGRLIEGHVVRGHRLVLGTPDDEGRAGVPAEDYQCID